jgi:hypothetical protein
LLSDILVIAIPLNALDIVWDQPHRPRQVANVIGDVFDGLVLVDALEQIVKSLFPLVPLRGRVAYRSLAVFVPRILDHLRQNGRYRMTN